MGFDSTVQQDIEQLTGVRASGQTVSKGLSATAARGALDATAKREMDISRNYKENFLIPILRKWLAMSREFMDEEQIVRVTGNEFVPIRRDDLDGNVDIQLKVSTPEADNERSQEIAFLLQTTAQSLPFDMTKMLLAEQMRLKNMPGLAKQISEYQPQPDQLEQERKALEVEKLKAEIAERQSRAQENQLDMKLKASQTELNIAKARQTHSIADKEDLSFSKDATGQSLQEAIELENVKSGNKMIEEHAKVAKPQSL
jgi:hypothetical protein